MATLEQLAEGIRRAHAAGDAAAVQKLGAAYRQMQAGGDGPPGGAKPGSREYADWAVEQARAGKELPQVSEHTEFVQPKPDGLGDKAFAAAGSFIEGVPVAGPTLIDLAKQGRAAVQGMDTDAVTAEFDAAKEANPISSLVGNVAGATAALAPLGATAVGGRLLGTVGSLGQRAGAGLASGGLIAAADTAARGGDAGDVGASTLVGGAIGGALPFVGAGIRRLISPAPAAAGKQAAAATLRNEGVELTAGQATGNKGLQYREAELGGAAAQDFMERQSDSFTAAALRRAGIDATRATPEVIDHAYTRIGQAFDGLAARNNLQSDARFAGELGQIWRDYSSLVSQSQRAPIVESTIIDLSQAVQNGGQLPGRAYQAIRSRIERAARATKDPELMMTLRDITSALDGVMERTIAQANPADLGAWQEARRAYRNMLVIEDAATRAGEKSADGIITPANLRSAAKKQGRRGFSRGRHEFAGLANAGVSAMTPLPESGTAQRLAAKAFMPLGAAAGAGVGGAVAGPLGAFIGGAAGAAIPWAAGRAMLSGPGRAYLGNQLAAGPLGQAALPPALLSLLATD